MKLESKYFSLTKLHMKLSSTKWRPICQGVSLDTLFILYLQLWFDYANVIKLDSYKYCRLSGNEGWNYTMMVNSKLQVIYRWPFLSLWQMIGIEGAILTIPKKPSNANNKIDTSCCQIEWLTSLIPSSVDFNVCCYFINTHGFVMQQWSQNSSATRKQYKLKILSEEGLEI